MEFPTSWSAFECLCNIDENQLANRDVASVQLAAVAVMVSARTIPANLIWLSTQDP
jgi:hypothetical protein